MVRGKPSNWSGPASGHTSHSLLEIGRYIYIMLQHHDYKDVVVLCSWGEWHWSMNRNDKQKVAWEWLDNTPSVCSRFILARLEFDSESSASHDDWDCLIPLLHRVRRGTRLSIINVSFLTLCGKGIKQSQFPREIDDSESKFPTLQG